MFQHGGTGLQQHLRSGHARAFSSEVDVLMRPEAALVFELMFDKLLLMWSRRLAAAPRAEFTVLTLAIAFDSSVMVALAELVSSDAPAAAADEKLAVR